MPKANADLENSLSLSELKEMLHYCPDTGIFTWIAKRYRRPANYQAGAKHPTGYINIKINQRRYPAHRLAFFYMTGEWPDIADHINRVRDDNRWVNLRSSNASENSCNRSMQINNTSGHRCVFWSKQRNKWKALIRKNGKEHFLGYFVEKSDAANAVKAHIGEIHGDFKGQIRNDTDIIAYRIIPERATNQNGEQ